MRWTPFIIALIGLLVPLGSTSAEPVPPNPPTAKYSWREAPTARYSPPVARLSSREPPGTGSSWPEPASGLSPPEAPVAGFSWPLAPPHPVLRQFQAPSVPWGPGHRGVDLGGQPGDPVLAVADGIVVFAGTLVDRPVISVDHAGGLRSTYEPVTPVVAAGQAVYRGEVLGHLEPGHPECTGAPACLHWGVRRGEEYLDPLALVTARHVRLLPWRG